MMNVLVFATSVDSVMQARQLAPSLNALVGPSGWNFDLVDCDRILRVTTPVEAAFIERLLVNHGFYCRELEDAIPESIEEVYKHQQV